MARALLGTKVGMTQIWSGRRVVPVTAVAVTTNIVSQVKAPERDGYSRLQIATGAIDPRRVNRPRKGHFAKAGLTPRRFIREVDSEGSLGDEFGPEIFQEGQLVDVVGKSKGKGFSGTMKRHNFQGVSATHGSHRNHRKPGSVGASSTPSRVFKGTRMAGRLGSSRVTVHNLRLVKIDSENGLLLVEGAVPGSSGSPVIIRDAVKGVPIVS